MEMAETGISLGKTYKDPITGFEGVAIAVTYWLHGCARVGLEAGYTVKDTGQIKSTIEWLDCDRVKNHEVVEGEDLTAEAVKTKSKRFTGGPTDSVDRGNMDPQ